MAAPEREVEIFLSPDEVDGDVGARALRVCGLDPATSHARVLRRSLDARKGWPLGFRYVVACGPGPAPAGTLPALPPAPPTRARVVIVGSGPAGSFAALRLIEAGARVSIVELGRQVPARRHDIARLVHDGALDPTSNYCFGEGGAGTFSDGKLYTRTKDREAVRAVLGTLVRFGADAEILIDSRPHIGSNRLPKVLLGLRARLLALGCDYHWADPVVDLAVRGGRVTGVRLRSGADLEADAVLLAAGHSARPLYAALAARGVALTAKDFAVGVRVEHPQPLIDEIQYGRLARHPRLPAAFYEVSAQAGDRGVYSFCMCPGGWVVPAATEPDGICTNGMSMSRRDSPLANAALVVTVRPTDHAGGPLDGVELQRQLERAAFGLGGGAQRAPAQRARDFLAGRVSADLPRSSYLPGVTSADLAAALPPFVTAALKVGLKQFERRLPGFLSADALLVAVETRTSSPLRIERDRATRVSPTHPGLYPVGEGAGYAGGIVSAAIDGLRTADAIMAAAAAA
ncbi:MAG TPA: FAD-binding protein [Polyangia bacterium]|jgi:hypothetical protein